MVLERLVFVSGLGATDPATGRLAGLDIETHTEQVFRNIHAILQAAGSDLSHVLRCCRWRSTPSPTDTDSARALIWRIRRIEIDGDLPAHGRLGARHAEPGGSRC